MKENAQLWYRIGWRERVVPNEEIACTGCSSHKQCTYQLVECTKAHNVEKCSLCEEFPCVKIRDMLSSMRVKQFSSNPNASIYFYHKGLIKYVGVMLVGEMEVLTDQEVKSELWRKSDAVFYKKGVTDPDYCVLKFTAKSGRYYCDLKTESFEV